MGDAEEQMMEHEPRYMHKPKYGTVGDYDAVGQENNAFEDIDDRAASKIRSPHRDPEYQWEAYSCEISALLCAAKTETLEQLCAKVPANILEELVQEWLMVSLVTYRFSHRGIKSHTDFLQNTHLITREAAVELAFRRAQEAPEEQKRLAKTQAETRKALLKSLFAGIVEQPQEGDAWVITGGFRYEIEKVGKMDDYEKPSPPGQYFTYEQVWKATVYVRNESGISATREHYTLKEFQAVFGEDFQDDLVAVERATG